MSQTGLVIGGAAGGGVASDGAEVAGHEGGSWAEAGVNDSSATTAHAWRLKRKNTPYFAAAGPGQNPSSIASASVNGLVSGKASSPNPVSLAATPSASV